jgi:hypothetical protein
MGSTAMTELYSGQVLLLATKPLWTDYVSAFGAAVGILVAAGAFVVAFRSARDSSRSADAAETTAASAHEQLVLARAEHEQLEANRRRRPIIERIHVGAIASGPGEEDPPAGVFSIGLTNIGDRDLQDAVLRSCSIVHPLPSSRTAGVNPTSINPSTRHRRAGPESKALQRASTSSRGPSPCRPACHSSSTCVSRVRAASQSA